MMKSLIAIAALLASMSVCAQRPEGQDWWACQSVAAAGLIREDNRWKTAAFNHDARFTLIDAMSQETEPGADERLFFFSS